MTYVLAIDQSTSATKALIFSAAGELLAKTSKDHEQQYPQPGWVEHDAEEIWQNTLAVVSEIAADYPQPVRLSIANQRETVVVFDRATGKLSGAIGSDVPSIGQLDSPGSAERYQRKMSSETADACYAGWKQAVKRVLL